MTSRNWTSVAVIQHYTNDNNGLQIRTTHKNLNTQQR